MEDNRFFICEHCGNIVGMIHDTGVPIMCCGEKMKHIEPGKVDSEWKNNPPKASCNDNSVKVDLNSPVEAWVYVQTDRGGQRKCLKKSGKTEVDFSLTEEKPVAVYAYSGDHGLWKTEI